MTTFVPATACPLADFDSSDAKTQRLEDLVTADRARAAQMARDPARLAEGPLYDLCGRNEEAARQLAHYLASAIRMGSVPACSVEAMEVANLSFAKAEIDRELGELN